MSLILSEPMCLFVTGYFECATCSTCIPHLYATLIRLALAQTAE